MSPTQQPQPAELQHPSIGAVRGNRVDGVLQFLGVKYASVDHWFDNPKLSTYDGSGIVADKHGPQAISDPRTVDNEFQLIQKALPKPEFPGISGTDCLTLNISVPEDATPSTSLPVLVFIHGGGFAVGSNWYPQYDMKRIVRLSKKAGKPMIGVNINYRLGAPGFMAHEELLQAGYPANRGLQDQHVALRWVQKYIAGFGGDPAQVTVSGESAGGLSVARLLYTEEALASRVVVMGGAPPSVAPLSSSVAKSTYETFTNALGLGNLSSEDRVTALAKVSSSELEKVLTLGMPFIPIVDGTLVPYHESFSIMATDDYVLKAKSCKAAMIVFSPLDASIFAMMGLFAQRKGLAASFAEAATSQLGGHPGVAARLLECYNITPDLDDETALLRILQFGSDIGFQAPALSLADKFSGDAFVMEFAEKNPWDGPFKGQSTHILDIAFLLQNYNEHLDATQQAAAEHFAQDVIAFVNGQQPWKPYSGSRGIAKLHGGRREYSEGAEATAARFSEFLAIGKLVGLDTLGALWGGFTFGGA